MDEYADLFYRQRGLEGIDLGPKIEARHALRSRLQCKSFRWFVDNVNSPEYYAPDPQGRVEMFKVHGIRFHWGCSSVHATPSPRRSSNARWAPCAT